MQTNTTAVQIPALGPALPNAPPAVNGGRQAEKTPCCFQNMPPCPCGSGSSSPLRHLQGSVYSHLNLSLDRPLPTSSMHDPHEQTATGLGAVSLPREGSGLPRQRGCGTTSGSPNQNEARHAQEAQRELTRSGVCGQADPESSGRSEDPHRFPTCSSLNTCRVARTVRGSGPHPGFWRPC